MARVDLDGIRRFVTANVPAELRGHCERTAAQARALAEHHGIDPDKAEAAGLLHDFVKYYSRDQLDEAIRDIGFGTLEFRGMPDPVVHGPAGALLVEQMLDLSDKEVLEAISLHSTGDREMGDVAKVVFLADYTEEGRDLPGIDRDREICFGDLDAAMLHVLSRKIAYLLDRHEPIDQRSWRAYNAFALRVRAR